MRIVMIGANGQVAAEVALLLASQSGIDLRPLIRSRGGSAFLRYQGIPVMHGSIADPATAAKALLGADVIANFALAGGTPSAALTQNEDIIRTTFEYSPPLSTVVFFSTLAVQGAFDESGRSPRNTYIDLKIRNERLVTSLAKAYKRRFFILRLGHVAGTYQNITAICRQDILSPPVAMPDPERYSNVTHTVAIADALIAIGAGRTGPPGLYDLVNVPQWTWREVYEKEAANLGVPLKLEKLSTSDPRPHGPLLHSKQIAFKLIESLGLRGLLTRMLLSLPGSFNEVAKAEYNVSRARDEIAALNQPVKVRSTAMYWPALEIRGLDGLSRTQDLFEKNIYTLENTPAKRWPADLTA